MKTDYCRHIPIATTGYRSQHAVVVWPTVGSTVGSTSKGTSTRHGGAALPGISGSTVGSTSKGTSTRH